MRVSFGRRMGAEIESVEGKVVGAIVEEVEVVC